MRHGRQAQNESKHVNQCRQLADGHGTLLHLHVVLLHFLVWGWVLLGALLGVLLLLCCSVLLRTYQALHQELEQQHHLRPPGSASLNAQRCRHTIPSISISCHGELVCEWSCQHRLGPPAEAIAAIVMATIRSPVANVAVDDGTAAAAIMAANDGAAAKFMRGPSSTQCTIMQEQGQACNTQAGGPRQQAVMQRLLQGVVGVV